MGFVLQIFGVIFLTMIALVVIMMLMIRSKLRGFLKTLEGLSRTMAIGPARVTLRPLAAASWANEAAARPLVEGLDSLGFDRVGHFEIEEIPGLELQAWIKPSVSVTGVIYEQSCEEHLLNYYTDYQDGSRLTYANTGLGEGVLHPPNHVAKRFPGFSARELFEQFMRDRPDKPAKPVSVAGFVEVFESFFAAEQTWKNSRGGANREEIRAIGSGAGEVYDEDVIEATHEFTERQALEELNEELRINFLEETKMSAADWERVRDRVIVIHDTMSSEWFEEVVGPWVDEAEFAPINLDSGAAPRHRFSVMNESMPKERRFQRLGSVASPISADVYAVPED